MAEWSGQKRTLNSIPPKFDPPLDDTAVHDPPTPRAPGATSSPQLPGMTPDDPDLPGKPRGTLPPLASDRRPLTEYGTAQRFLGLFTPEPGTELQASDWEQGPAAMEEIRKADPVFVTPVRPHVGSALGIGRSTKAIALEALETPDEATAALPATEVALEAATPVAQEVAVESSALVIPPGAVLGDGTPSCPADYPVKGNASSKIFHTPDSRSYAQTIPEICFSNAEAAQAAGYRSPKQI